MMGIVFTVVILVPMFIYSWAAYSQYRLLKNGMTQNELIYYNYMMSSLRLPTGTIYSRPVSAPVHSLESYKEAYLKRLYDETTKNNDLTEYDFSAVDSVKQSTDGEDLKNA